MRHQPDLVIRAGTIFDGLGGSPATGDIAIHNGKIIAIGQDIPAGREEIDASGCIVTPGFVDVHTHYDGQLVWSDRLAPSSSHGVTTAIVGNCGVGFAPCRQADQELLVSVMEGVEDIPEAVMASGLDWSWESFPEYLDTIDSRPHDIDFAAYLPHSALRLFVMGKRGADREPARTDDLAAMTALAKQALEAGAFGFATSNVPGHRTGRGEFIPSYLSGEAEYLAIADAMRETGKGLFQIVPDFRAQTPQEIVDQLVRIGKRSGGTVTFSLNQFDSHPDAWRHALEAVAVANQQTDVRVVPQVFSRPIGMIFGLSVSHHPFLLCPSFAPLRDLSLSDRVKAMRNPELRAALLRETPHEPNNPLFVISRDFTRMYPFETTDYEPSAASSFAAQSQALGISPEELVYDKLLEHDGNALLLATLTNYSNQSLDAVREMIGHSETIVALGDGGAHYGFICDASFPTHFLAYWTRDRSHGRVDLATAVRMLSHDPATLAGFQDRGRIAPGYKADLNVIDYDKLSLELPHVVFDLPGGGKRIDQAASGYRATIVSGEIILRDDRPTGALPGKLQRGPQPPPQPL